MQNRLLQTLILMAGIGLCAATAHAAKLHIAVASNFIEPMKALAAKFEQQSSFKVILSSGSTGKHYAQIIHGAPFELFFAADKARPRRLEQEGKVVAGSRFTYAIGQIVLWSPRTDFVDSEGKILEKAGFNHLAIANPKFAPYGEAARQILKARGLWHALQGRLVRGENIAQAYQFVKSGNAELGFVAWSQIRRPHRDVPGSYWHVPARLYSPIEQQAVILRETAAAKAFVSFVKSKPARKLIAAYGYHLPD
jgi:molybdate transport system substrate-binding protein